MFYLIIFLIFYLLLVVSRIFHRFAVCFEWFMNIACSSTTARIKLFLKLHIVIKLSINNKHNKFCIMLKRNSFKISLQIWRLSKIKTGWPYRWSWEFLNGSLKAHACFDGPEYWMNAVFLYTSRDSCKDVQCFRWTGRIWTNYTGTSKTFN